MKSGLEDAEASEKLKPGIRNVSNSNIIAPLSYILGLVEE
jgi:hypothetical protein